jgi:hypothetical protein
MERVDIFYLLLLGLFYSYLIYFVVIWYVLRSLGAFYGPLVCFMVIW